MNEQQELFIGIPFWVITLINYCVCDPNAQLDNPNSLYFYELLSMIPCNFTFLFIVPWKHMQNLEDPIRPFWYNLFLICWWAHALVIGNDLWTVHDNNYSWRQQIKILISFIPLTGKRRSRVLWRREDQRAKIVITSTDWKKWNMKTSISVLFSIISRKQMANHQLIWAQPICMSS